MDIGYEIESNGIGTKLGSALQEGLNNDLNKIKSGTTAGKVSTIIQGNGTTEEKVVNAASTVISSMSTTAIGNDLNTVRQMANDYTDVDSITNAAVDVVENAIDSLMDDSGTSDAIQAGIDATTDFINMLKKAVYVADQSGQILNVLSLIGTSSNTTNIPSVKECTQISSASSKNKIVELYKDIKQQFVDMYNQLVCTNCDSTLDNVMISVNGILDYLSTYLDPVMQDYTGYTLTETRYYTAYGFQIMKMFKRVSQNLKKKEEEKAAQEQVNEISNNIVEESSNTISQTTNEAKNAMSNVKSSVTSVVGTASTESNNIGNTTKSTIGNIENIVSSTSESLGTSATSTANNIKNNTTQQFTNLQQDYTKDEIKEKLLDWANNQSIILLNAFHLLVIKDLITQIKEKCENLGNMSIENFADFVNGIQEVFNLLELLGFYPGSEGITFEDLTNIAKALSRSAKGIIINVEDMSDDIVAQTLDTTKTVVDNTNNNISNSNSQISSSVSSTSNSVSSQVDSITNSTTSQTSNLVSSASSTNNVISTSATNISNAINQESTKSVASLTNTTNSAVDAAANAGSVSNAIKSTGTVATQGVSTTVTGAVSTTTSTTSSITNDISDELSSESSAISSASSQTISSISNATTQSASEVTNLGAQTSSASEQLVSSTINDAAESYTSILSGISLTALLDMSEVESIISGKVMMFDVVIQMFNILKPIINILVLLCHLQENYQVNKQTVANKAQMSLDAALKNIANTVLGLSNSIESGNNFYTVRTNTLYKWCISSFNCDINQSGMSVISETFTNKLIKYLNSNNVSYNSDQLKENVQTTLYFDMTSINDTSSTYKDGSMDGIDNIIIDSSGNIYYDEYDRSTMSSQILKAQKRNENPGYVVDNDINDGINEDNEEISLDDITVETDEIEGQQTISIPDMNLCEPSDEEGIEETEEIGIDSSLSYAIIEFGDTYTLGDEVSYTLAVKPGQNLTLQTKIADVTINGSTFSLYSKFSKGYVKSKDETNDDYFHVYPQSCYKHIVIAEYEEGTTYDASDATKINDKFKEATNAASNILTYLPYINLPIILNNANRTSIKTNTLEIFNQYVEIYENAVTDLSNGLGQNDKLANDIKETKGDPDKVKAIMDNMLDKRENLINTAIDIYEKSKNTQANGSYTYQDCTNLAFGSNNNDIYQFAMSSSGDLYANYYMSLYSMVDSESDDKNVIKYREILKNIIDRRLKTEKYDLYNLMLEFNTLFNSAILGLSKTKVSNPFVILYNMNQTSKLSYNDVEKYIKKSYIQSHATKTELKYLSIYQSEEDQEKIEQWWADQEKSFIGTTSLYQTTKRLTNIFFYIITAGNNVIPIKSKAKVKSDDEQYNQCKEVGVVLFQQYFTAKYDEDKTIEELTKEYDKAQKQIAPVTINPSTGLSISMEYSKQDRINFFINYLKETAKKENGTDISKQNSEIIDLYSEYLYDITAYLYAKEKHISGHQLEEKTSDFIENRLAYLLVQKESKELIEYWDDVINKYRKEYQINNVIQELQDYADSLQSMNYWPQSQNITIGEKDFQLYIFQNRNTISDAEAKQQDTANDVLSNLDADKMTGESSNQELDYTKNDDISEPDEGTVRGNGYLYWLVYMMNATLITLLPTYWSDGFDIPPAMVPMPLPAIYFPLANPIEIPMVHVTMVIGLSLRGIWPSPIILYINNNSYDINSAFPAMIALEITKKSFQSAQEYTEKGIKKAIDATSTLLIGNTDNQKKLYDKFMLYASLIKAIPVEDKEYIEKEFYESLYGTDAESYKAQQQKKVTDVLTNVVNTTTDAIKTNVSTGISNYITYKTNQTISISSSSKTSKMDRRQVITRLDKLGTGPEPF